MFSSSERIYETGSRDDIKVPFRKVIQENTKGEEGEHENPQFLFMTQAARLVIKN